MTESDMSHPQAGVCNWARALVTSVLTIAGYVLAGSTAQAQQPAWKAQSPQYVQCPSPFQPLLRIPEIVAADGKLRGTMLLSNNTSRMYFAATDPSQCQVQDVRQLSSLTAVLPAYPGAIPPNYPNYAPPPPFPGYAPPPPVKVTDPVPGPTLRARVGDIVELSFLNQIGSGPYWATQDRGEKGLGCDQAFTGQPPTAIYPGNDPFPDCFHGSTTGNIHFHGTHTNPGSTGDNIFIEVRPSLRDASGAPVVTPASIKQPFDQFFANCEAHLKNNVLSQWPNRWSDMPAAWAATQKALLQRYDQNPTIVAKLWPANAAQLAVGAWPEFSIGATPYCFRLPEYTPPGPHQTAHPAAHSMPGMEDTRALLMGQAPGTHWYHAHKHGSTAIDVSNGMAGAFIIEGQYDDALNAFYGTGAPASTWARTQPVMVINQLGTLPNLFVAGNSNGPLPFSVNGRIAPTVTMQPGQVQLWRIVNASSRSGVYLAGFAPYNPNPQNATSPPVPPAPPTAPSAPQVFAWKQTAQDGVQFNGSNYQNSVNPTLMIASGNRADLLVQAPSAAGTYVLLAGGVISRCMTVAAQNPAFVPTIPVASKTGPASPICPTPGLTPLLIVTVTGSPAAGPLAQFIPPANLDKVFPTFLSDIKDSEVRGTKTIVFDTTRTGGKPSTVHTIDGHRFDGNIGAVVLLNNAEEWKIENRTVFGEFTAGAPARPKGPPGEVIDHPFHIHINPFQIVEFFDPNEVLMPSGIMKYIFYQGPAPTNLQPGQCALDIDKPDSWKPCGTSPPGSPIWWDVFAIPSARAVYVPTGGASPTGVVHVPGYFKMRSRFVDFTGQYVIHCHILAHEDRGMMTVVDVVPFTTPYSHH